MPVHTDYLWFHTKHRQEFIRITDQVAKIVAASAVKDGIVLVSAMHITAGVYVNDWEDGLIHDFQEWLEKLAPAGKPYRHHQTGEDNADAHLKRTIMGHQVIVPITAGKLDLGPWEQIFYAEFDGQRRKRVVVKVIGISIQSLNHRSTNLSMTDELDLVRLFFHALNDGDVDRLASLYHPGCIVEHIFVDDAGVYEGRDQVRGKWAAELAHFEGALAGGHRFDVQRVAGMQTGWGWARADWVRAVRDPGTGAERSEAGYSHFWIEDGLIVRHRSIAQSAKPASGVVDRHHPTRPVVGVGAVVLMDDGRVVLVKRKYEPLAGQWSLPGGALELGETLESGTAREILEETGLVVNVGPVVEVFDRILMDEAGQVGYHFVLVDYLCRPRGGTLAAGSDVDAVALADPAALSAYRITQKAQAVIARAVQMKEGR